MLIETLGNKKSTVICNLLIIFSLLIYIVSQNVVHIIIGDFIYAFGVCIKNISEGNLIYAYLKRKDGNLDRMNDIYGKTSSRYLFLDAITGLSSGILFIINPYLPIILAIIFFIIPTYLSCQLDEVEVDNNVGSHKVVLKEHFKDIKRILYSKRLIALFLYAAMFAGIIKLTFKYYQAYLTVYQFDARIFGIVYTMITLIKAISSYKQDKIENLNKRRILKIISLPYVIGFIIIGLISTFNSNSLIVLIPFLLILCMQGISMGVYDIYMKRYLSTFVNMKNRTLIITIGNIVENLGRFIVLFIGGIILDNMKIQTSYILIGIVSTVIMLAIVNFMKKRVGLNPEEYKETDIFETGI